jgi:deazaflavin-dependent oxidoreductase (nitroreductase family)
MSPDTLPVHPSEITAEDSNFAALTAWLGALAARPPSRFQRLIKTLAATRPGAWLLIRVLRHLDRFVLHRSGGKHTATSLLTGLPVIWLSTTGAKTGQVRTVPLLAGVDGECLVVCGTNFGGEKSPGWVYNLRANPSAVVSYHGVQQNFLARPATPAEEDQYWPLVEAMYTGYAAYRQRVTRRTIWMFVLEVDTSRS